MLNFETMTVEQMKPYCTAEQLSKMENQDLANILLVTNGLLNYLANRSNVEDQIEKTYWNCVFKLVDKEFKKRNIQACYTDTMEAFAFINETLVQKEPGARKSALNVLHQFSLPQLVAIRKELEEDVNSLEAITALLDEVILSSQQLN